MKICVYTRSCLYAFIVAGFTTGRRWIRFRCLWTDGRVYLYICLFIRVFNIYTFVYIRVYVDRRRL